VNIYIGDVPMRKEPFIVFSVLLLVFLAFVNCSQTVDAKSKNANVLIRKADISGDGIDDEVSLKRYNKFRDKRILLTTKLSNGKSHEIKLEDGFDQKLSLVDFDHDGIKDVFVRITDKEGSKHYLYSFKDFVFNEMIVPELPTIQGQFLDGYSARIGIQETKMEYTFRLKPRKKKYDSLGIYQNGKVNEPTELVIKPYEGYKATKINEGEYGLKGVQMVSGIEKDDSIGLVETYYSWLNGNWILKKVMVLEVSGR
jgi:hypothetical protein